MKQLHSARHAVEAHLIRGFLMSNGIAAEVRGEYLTSGWGELPVDVCSVWIVDDAEFARANELLVAFLSGSFARKYSGERWTCPECGEKLEGQFTSCWNCGTARVSGS
jgi:putative signal transducing protein